MSRDRLLITPQTKVAELLEAYPQLETTLIEIAAPFKKLRNPVLRRTVARVTSLAQAARVGNVSVTEMVQRLRREVGQPEFVAEDHEASGAEPGEPPEWFDKGAIEQTVDARPIIEKGEQPLGPVMGDLRKLPQGAIYELITPFEPAPLIDRAKEKGFAVWSTVQGAGDFRTYFMRE